MTSGLRRHYILKMRIRVVEIFLQWQWLRPPIALFGIRKNRVLHCLDTLLCGTPIVLKSLILRQLFRRPQALDTQLEEWKQSPYYDEASLRQAMSGKARFLQENGYLHSPAIVHVETLAVCNAACVFCPYPTLARQGEKMPDALIDKIIGDLAEIPGNQTFQFAPYKVSEPFVEPRLFDILAQVNARLPNARISLISNGSPLTGRKLEQLAQVRNVAYLNISLNAVDAAEYEALMKLPFERTVARLDALHAAKGGRRFPVRLTRVSGGRDADLAFVEWVNERYPSFEPAIIPRNDWIGERPSPEAAAAVPDAPCHRWFDISVTATGVVAMCCMDGEAKYPKGDVRTQHLLDIYNQPRLLEFRRTLMSRRAAGGPCDRCTYMSY